MGYSMFIDPQDYDFSQLDEKISLVENDPSGLTEDEQDPVLLENESRWIKRRGLILTIVLVIIWPLLSVPAGTFTENYFSFWVLISIVWGFGAAVIITVLPLAESQDDIGMVFNRIYNRIAGSLEVEWPSTKNDETVRTQPQELNS